MERDDMSAPIIELIAAVHAAGGAIERQGREIKLTAAAPLPDALVARLRAAKPALLAYFHQAVVEPVILADGRRLHRFRAAGPIPPSAPRHLLPLINAARSRDAVLVADGPDLIVIEPWLNELPPSTLRALVAEAAGVLSWLRAAGCRSRKEVET
jgi:hypothetical protein